jgi:FkbM family methyltransferase
MINGIYEKNILKLINNNLPINTVFIDVGANIGAISVLIANRRPDITIYAFEASPKVFKFLKLNKEQNHLNNLYVYNIAIHLEDNINLPFYSPDILNGKGSFSPIFTTISENVETISLDTFFINNSIKPSIIKVDVEGYEYLIFKSMELFLTGNINCKIIFEFVDWAEDLAKFEIGKAQEYLINLGYNLIDISTNDNIHNKIQKGSAMILAKKIT